MGQGLLWVDGEVDGHNNLEWTLSLGIRFAVLQEDLLIKTASDRCMICRDQLLSHTRFSGWGNKRPFRTDALKQLWEEVRWEGKWRRWIEEKK